MTKRMKLLKDGPWPPTTAEFNPGVGYIEPKVASISRHRSTSGREYSYQWYCLGKWEVPLKNILAVTAVQINAWWCDADSLYFYPDQVADPTKMHHAQIINRQAPLIAPMVGHWRDVYEGALEIEEIEQ